MPPTIIPTEKEKKDYEKAKKIIKSNNEFDKLQEAETILRELHKEHKECMEFIICLGRIELLKENYKDASERFKSIIKYNKHEELWSCFGEKRKSIAWALHDLGEAYYHIGEVNRNKQMYSEAEIYFRDALDAIKDLKICKDIAWFINDLGEAYYKLKKFKMAQDLFMEAVEKVPDNGNFRLNLGEAYFSQGFLDNAKRQFQNAFDIFDKKLQKTQEDIITLKIAKASKDEIASLELKKANLELGKASALIDKAMVEINEEFYDIAEVNLNKANNIYKLDNIKKFIENLPPIKRTRENGKKSALHNNLGIIFYKRGSYNEAKNEFKEAFDYKPESARSRNNLANVYVKQGNKDIAEKLYREALIKDPELISAKENIKLLSETRTTNWWKWWFGGSSWPKKAVGGALILLLFFLIVSVPFSEDYSVQNTTITNVTTEANPGSILFQKDSNQTWINKSEKNQDKENITNITTKEITMAMPIKTETNTGTTTHRRGSPESQAVRLALVALVIFLLIHPQVKGFSAGTIKFDLEPVSDAKGVEFNIA